MVMTTGKDIDRAAELILSAWRDPNKPLVLPENLRPGNLAHAYGIQQAVSRGLGTIGGWIICNSAAIGVLTCAPMPLASIRLDEARFASDDWTFRRVRAKMCFRIVRIPMKSAGDSGLKSATHSD